MIESQYTPSGMPILLAPLEKPFLASPYLAAPERMDDLKKLIEINNISLRLKPDCRDWLFEEFSMGNLVYSNARTLERIWAYAYGFVAIITEMQIAEKWDAMPESYHLGFRLLLWANQSSTKDVEESWPIDLPHPGDLSTPHAETANNVFLMMSSRLLLHEIAHLALGHSGDSENKKSDPHAEEFQADQWADEWMLSRWQEYKSDPKIFASRALGIAISYAPLLMLSVDSGKGSETHPSPMKRIIRFTERYFKDANPSAKKEEDFPVAFLFSMIVSSFVLRGKGVVEIEEFPETYLELFQELESRF